MCAEPCCPGDAEHWEAGDESLCLLCLCVQLSLNFFISTHEFSHFYASNSLPHSAGRDRDQAVEGE